MESMSGQQESKEGANSVIYLPVICGTTKGTFLIDKDRTRVHCDGQEMTPTQFEKHAGRGACKKWKISVRLLEADGTSRPIKQWLDEQNIQIGPQPPVSSHPRERRDVANVPGLLEHYEAQHVGYRPGDPTAGSPPEDFSDADSDALIIDLATISNADMQHLCRASQCGIDPFRDLLSNQPGVRPNRQAHFTGFSPPERAADGVKADERASEDDAVALDQYLSNQTVVLPTLMRPLRFNGVDVDIRQLWQLVQACGGSDSCTQRNLWDTVGYNLGHGGLEATQLLKFVPPLPGLLRNYFDEFLRPKEQRDMLLKECRPSPHMNANVIAQQYGQANEPLTSV